MAEIEDKNRKLPSPRMTYTEGYITLPVTEEQFRDFIKSLLGRPETLEKRIKGNFALSRQAVINFHFLLEQRIQQQNDAKLVQFQAKIFFDDDSTVTLNSIESLATYNQIRPLVVIGVELNWVFLIKFQDKSVPERQEIQIRIITDEEISVSKYRRRQRPLRITAILEEYLDIERISYFDISIRYTAKTWGEDIISLLSEHIKTLLIRNEGWSDILNRNSAKVLWVSTVVFTLIFWWALHSWFISHPPFDIRPTIETMIRNGATLEEKVNFLLRNFSDLNKRGDAIENVAIYVMAVAFAALLGTFMSTLVERKYQSFVLLTEETEKAKSEYEERQKKSWRIFVGSAIFSLVIGIVGNIIVLLVTK